MAHATSSTKQPLILHFLFNNSLFLITGTLVALVWANLDPPRKTEDGRRIQGSYQEFIHYGLPLPPSVEMVILGPPPRELAAAHGAADTHTAPHGDTSPVAESDATGPSATVPSATEPSGTAPTDSDLVTPEETAATDAVADSAPAQADGTARQFSPGRRPVLPPPRRSDQTSQRTRQPDAGPVIPFGAEDELHATHPRMSIHYLVQDLLMAFFFAIAAKEVWEAFLPGGALSNIRKAATPLMATIGGVLGPVAVYILGAMLFNSEGLIALTDDPFRMYSRGWAIPTATDIAFSYLFARLIFGTGHPAIAFLLLLAIADDGIGLAILAIFYPQGGPYPIWFLVTAAAMGIAYGFRRMGITNFWIYVLIPGVLCWWSFQRAGLHAALGLVPIIPLMPSAKIDHGLFAGPEEHRHDTLNEFEHFFKYPVEVFLGLFGLVSAGVVLNSIGLTTFLVLGGLLVGKPIGITLLTMIAEKGFGLQRPAGMSYAHVATVAMIAGVGFTVALFVCEVAFPRTDEFATILNDGKLGALLSFLGGFFAFLMARAFGIKKNEHVVIPSDRSERYTIEDIEPDSDPIGSQPRHPKVKPATP